MFANHGEEDGIYPLTTTEIATAQKERSPDLFKRMQKHRNLILRFQLIKDTIVLYKDENQSSQHIYR